MTKPKPAFVITVPLMNPYGNSVVFKINKRLVYVNKQTGIKAVWYKGTTLRLQLRRYGDSSHAFIDKNAPLGLKCIRGVNNYPFECLEVHKTKPNGSHFWLVPTVETEEEGVNLAINTTIQQATNLDGYDGTTSNLSFAQSFYGALGINLTKIPVHDNGK